MDQNIEFNNYEVLEQYLEFKTSVDENLVTNHKIARISKTLYNYSNAHKLLYHILIKNTEVMQYSSDELKGTKRFLEASFLNYKLNLQKIKKLKDQYKFDIVFLQPPYRESFKGEYEIPIGGDRKRITPEFVVEEYLKGLNKIRTEIDWKLDFINFKDELKEYCNG